MLPRARHHDAQKPGRDTLPWWPTALASTLPRSTWVVVCRSIAISGHLRGGWRIIKTWQSASPMDPPGYAPGGRRREPRFIHVGSPFRPPTICARCSRRRRQALSACAGAWPATSSGLGADASGVCRHRGVPTGSPAYSERGRRGRRCRLALILLGATLLFVAALSAPPLTAPAEGYLPVAEVGTGTTFRVLCRRFVGNRVTIAASLGIFGAPAPRRPSGRQIGAGLFTRWACSAS